MPDAELIPLLAKEVVKLRVSSVLNRDTKTYGKQHLLDASEETCWNSDEGAAQWVDLQFDRPVEIFAVHLMCQGGFVPREAKLTAPPPSQATDAPAAAFTFYPDDVNSRQVFTTDAPLRGNHFRLHLSTSSDFFGRVTIYHLQMYGREVVA
ncbi:hypothetical protein CXG81DRAFT_20583 [Caulochytrium protostelioides]|nr:hypothetical protein CXG81DRAFT_20583 [Caulochytrium protostelioides]|eukprot:RKO99310.1 hypothetical protein CXG81DRAFT_20583 [Caulochytrium protostelioides]